MHILSPTVNNPASANFESWPVVLFPFCAGIVQFFPPKKKNEKQKVTGSLKLDVT
jgi:hypothetical protein